MGRTKEGHVFKFERLILTAIKNSLEVGIRYQNAKEAERVRVIGNQGYELAVLLPDNTLEIAYKHAIESVEFNGLRTHDIAPGPAVKSEYDAEPVLDYVVETMGGVVVKMINGDIIEAKLVAKEKYFLTFEMDGDLYRSVNKAHISRINVGAKEDIFRRP